MTRSALCRSTPWLIFCLVLLLPSTSRAVAYTFTVIDVPGATFTVANDINDAGQIVGNVDGGGFLLDSGTFTSINPPGSTLSAAFGINNAGQIVGGFNDATGAHGFLKDGSAFTMIDVPGATVTTGRAIGSLQIVGDASGSVGFLYDGFTFAPVGVPGATATNVFGTNEAGEIVGRFRDSSGLIHGYVRDTRGIFTTLDAPGAVATSAEDINELGQIVGDFSDGVTTHGFVLNGTSFLTIDVPGAISTSVTGINNSGLLVGHFTGQTGSGHGFLATPVPEPSVLLLVASGWAGLAAWGARQGKVTSSF